MKLAWLRGSGLAARFSKNLLSRMKPAGGLGVGFAERNFLSSIQCTGQCLVDQLVDGLDDPAPCCVAVVIVTRGERVSAVQHQGGGASDVDLGNQRSQPAIAHRHDDSSASMTGYPRDLVGYADQPPDPRWPGGARLALNFVVNYEEGGERSVLHGDKVAETRLTDLLTPAPLQGARDLNMESAYEYGSRVGFWRLMRVFAERQVIPTIYAVGMALERNPQVAEAMARQGCDVVDHWWRWIDYQGIDEATEREHIRLSVETIRRLTGTRPVGWYIGTPSANTRRLVVEEGGFLYDSDAYNDELPYWIYDYGRPHLIIPHTLDDNDTRLARGQGWGQAEDFLVSLRDNFDALYREGEHTPKMMTVAVHCRLAGKPARAAAFARFVDHILRHDRVWICRRNEIAEH